MYLGFEVGDRWRVCVAVMGWGGGGGGDDGVGDDGVTQNQCAFLGPLLVLRLSSLHQPFRVPWVGKVSHCLFDKTGTLTTDQLVPVGVVCAGRESPKDRSSTSVTTAAAIGDRGVDVGDPVVLMGLDRADLNGRVGVVLKGLDVETNRVTVQLEPLGGQPGLTARFRPECMRILLVAARPTVPVKDASPEASVVLATCHAVVSVEGAGLVGDPIELAALQVRGCGGGRMCARVPVCPCARVPVCKCARVQAYKFAFAQVSHVCLCSCAAVVVST
jgi:hypothetical protein